MHILHKNIIEWKQEKNNVYNVSEGRGRKRRNSVLMNIPDYKL